MRDTTPSLHAAEWETSPALYLLFGLANLLHCAQLQLQFQDRTRSGGRSKPTLCTPHQEGSYSNSTECVKEHLGIVEVEVRTWGRRMIFF